MSPAPRRDLNLPASAVSHGLGRLRRLFGDPLFLRIPRGVVPTARALALAGPLGEVLAGARGLVAAAAPFDPRPPPASSPSAPPMAGASSTFLGPLPDRLRAEAPGVNLRLRQLLPAEGGCAPAEPWRAVFTALGDRALDLAAGPFADVPARFAARTLGHEDFVVVARAGHPFAATAGLEAYCAAGHILVSQTGDARGFVDRELDALGLARRVAPTVPGFFMALTLAARTGLPAAVPRSFVATHGPALGLVATEAPLALPHSPSAASCRGWRSPTRAWPGCARSWLPNLARGFSRRAETLCLK